MSAREDYAKLHANTSGPHHQGQTSSEAQAALDEIDRLRETVETVADRVRSIADTVDRPGVYNLLHEIADELDAEQCEWCHGNRPPANVVAPPCHRCHGTGDRASEGA